MEYSRNQGIGSSDVAAILGLSKWKTPLDVYLSKVSPIESTPTRQMVRGIICEPLVIEFLKIDKNIVVVERNKRVFNDVYPFLTTEIDAIDESGLQIEIKTSNAFMSKFWGDDIESIPIEYLAQIYWSMGINKKQNCLLAVLIDFDVKYYQIKQNNKFFNAAVLTMVDFWNEHIIKKIPPQPSTTEDLIKLFPNSSGEKNATNDFLNDILELKKIKNVIKENSVKKDELEFKIKAFFGDKETIKNGNDILATFKMQHKKEFIVKENSSKVLRIK
jgi:putative phage-type endonuclease